MENDAVEAKSRFSKLFSKSTVKGATAIAVGAVIGIVLVNKLTGNSNDNS